MILIYRWLTLWGLSLLFTFSVAYSQETRDYDELDAMDSNQEYELKTKFSQLVFFEYRGTNIFEVAGGAATLVGAPQDTDYSFYFKLGFKRSFTDNLFLGVSYNNYKLAYGTTEQSLNSFDFNLEVFVLPYEKLSPFVYGGFGYNANDDYSASAVKVQGGFGAEFIVTDKLGLKLFAEYNYSLDDEIDFLIIDQEDDSFLRVGLGVNIYFGGDNQKEKRLERIPTQIKSNPIIEN